MDQPVLIVVNGLSGTGKTGLARRLAGDMRLPCVGNDQLKEVMFDTLGWSDLAWSERLQVTSSALLWSVTDSIVCAGHSLVIENHFHEEIDAPRLRELHERYDVRIAEIHCYADRELLVRRVQERIEKGDRHPGHGETDRQTLEGTVIPNLRHDSDPWLEEPDFYILIDMGEFDDDAYEDLRCKVEDFMAGATPVAQDVVEVGKA